MVVLNAGKVAAAGHPAAVMTVENINRVFGVSTTIITDPAMGTPMCIPTTRSNVPARSNVSKSGMT